MRDLLISDIVVQAAARAPNALAVSVADRHTTFGELADLVDGIAMALLDYGVGHGDRVLWQAETSVEAVAINFATAKIGAVFVPISPRASSTERDRLLAHARAAITLGDQASGMMELDELLGRNGRRCHAIPVVRENDPQVLYYTSGTTGDPKGCLLSHRAQWLRSLKGRPWVRNPYLMMFPQFHMAGWGQALEAWYYGTHVVYAPKAEAEDLIGAIEKHRAELLYCIPAVWKRILAADRTGRDLSSLRSIDTGTSLVTPELLAQLGEAFPGGQISVAYGSTEAGMVCMLGHDDIAHKAGTVGRAAPGNEIRIADDGVLLARNHWLFSGYFDNPDATAAALRDGWYVTGDLAEQDEDGFYRIVGRAGDLIRSGGETIAPVEIEAVLQTHPAVADIAVTGVADETWGEIVTALVVVKSGQEVALGDLRQICEGRLAPHKHPRRLVVVDQLPRTGATRQLQRKLLPSLILEASASPSSKVAI